MNKGSLNISQNFEEHVASVKSKGEHLIKTVVPLKIDQLNKLIDSHKSEFNYEQHQILLSEPIPKNNSDERACYTMASKTKLLGEGNRQLTLNNHFNGEKAEAVVDKVKVLLPEGSIKCNAILANLIDILKPLARELKANMEILKMWVILMMPKIEDGNNFGVAIQEKILSSIYSAEEYSASANLGIVNYHLQRGKIISKVLKYPFIDNYREAVAEIDKVEFFTLLHIIIGFRNYYVRLYDLITKNWEKLLVPRTSNSENMY